MKTEQKNTGSEKALQKIRQFCSYQERTHQEVKDKLYGYGLYKKDVELLLTQMIEENYLNEERFAIAFAGGKFRVKQWGRVKIKYELKQKQVSEYSIKKAMKQIGEEEYLALLHKLTEEKYAALKKEQYLIRKKKTMYYLMAKGFEPELVRSVIEKG